MKNTTLLRCLAFAGLELLLAFVLLAPVSRASAQGGASKREAEKEAGKDEIRDRRLIKSKDFYIEEEGAGKYEELAREKRAEAIELLKGIIASGNVEGDQQAELFMRLAELYWETAKDRYLVEMTGYLAEYDEWVDASEEDRGPEPVEDHTESIEYNRLAIDLYRQILRDHRNYERLDEVHFNLGFNLMDLGQDQQALEHYRALVKNFPRSSFVADAYLQLGEYHFEDNAPFKALQYYRKAATFTDSKTAVFATYKLGWCYYNVGEPQRAVDMMKKVIAESGDDQDEAGKLSLRDEALKDLVLFFSEAKDLEAAYEYFYKFGEKKYFFAMLKRLAGTYLEQGKNELAIETYTRLINEDPMSKDAPTYQNDIIGAYFKSGNKQQTLSEIDRLVDIYGKGSEWAVANAGDATALRTANGLIDKNLRNVAVDYYKEAQSTRSNKTYHLARQTYEKYLSLFPDGKFAYDMTYGYAEVLYALKIYDAAATQYEKVIALDLDGKYFKVSASSLLLAIDKMLEGEKKEAASSGAPGTSEGGDEGKERQPVALTAWEQRKIKACDIVGANLPQQDDTPAILYEAARIFYDKKHFDESAARFLAIVESYPSTEVAEVSANLLLDIYNQLEDWENLDKYARDFHERAEFRESFKKELTVLYEQASFKKIERLEEAGDDKGAAEAFLQFQVEFPKSKLADRALFNSAYYAFNSGDFRESLRRRKLLLEVYPGSEFALQSLDALGKMYESIAAYEQAAEYYEKLAQKDAGREYPGTADALYNAGLFRDSLGQWKKAVENYLAYVRDFKDREDAHLVLLEAARIYQAAGQDDDAAAIYRRYFTSSELAGIDVDATFAARLRYGRVLREQGKQSQALSHYEQSVALFDRMSRAGTEFKSAAQYVAEMKFHLMQPVFDDYKSIRLNQTKTSEQRKAFEKKTKMVNKVVEGYTQVLSLRQGEWGIAALYMIGETFHNMAVTILESPMPPHLTEEQKKIYRAGLEDTAFPLVDKAASAFEQALAKSYELGIYNDYTADAVGLLAKLRPKEYPESVEKLGEADRLSDLFYVADFVE